MKQQREKAVALRYREHDDRAPRVIAKGEGGIAKTIRDLAEKNGIPIHRDDALVELLAQIEIDREIPPELYTAIAELLSWIYRANNALKKENAVL
jgi:flagellar biosynthesis protein